MAHSILISDGLDQAAQTLLRANSNLVDAANITAAELLTVIPDYDALIVRSRTRVTAQVLEVGRKLRVIGRAGVGLDNVDLRAAAARGVAVVYCPLASTVTVAEHTLALLLALARMIPAADASVKAGRWERNVFTGCELDGKTLGLIGIGNIGAEVARRAAAFGMTVLAHDPRCPEDEVRQRLAEPIALPDLLARSDFISIHTPLTDETRGLLGAREIAQMKRGAYLICTARGNIVDEDALRAALDAGALAGAALDVFAQEPPAPASVAFHPKVIATPHCAAFTVEAQHRAGMLTAEQVLAVLAGQTPRFRVV
jgi:D-3-phosphoglycerate dehydrogenase